MFCHPFPCFRLSKAASFAAAILVGHSLFADTGTDLKIDDLVPRNGDVALHVEPRVPVGKALIFPVTVTNPNGKPLQFTVTSSNPKVFASVRTGLPKLKMAVSHDGDPANGDPQFSGTLEFLMLRDLAPLTVGTMGGFAQGHYFDGLVAHRITDLDSTAPGGSFIIQGGDPVSASDPAYAGLGGPGFSFANEFHPSAMFTGRGQLAMANAGSNPSTYEGTNGSQFFITDGSPRHLDFNHNIFGQLVRGWDTLKSMAQVPTRPAGSTTEPPANYPKVALRFDSTTVEQDFSDAVLLLSATAPGTATITVTVTDAENQTDTKQFDVTAVADTHNSPPFLRPVPNQTVALNKIGSVALTRVDLESDYTIINAKSLSNSNGQAAASGGRAYFRGATNFVGEFNVGADVKQYDMDYRGTADGSARSSDDSVPILITVGDKQVRTFPKNITGTPGAALTEVVARYVDGDTVAQASDFTATVIWGDGSFNSGPTPNGNLASKSVAANAEFPATVTRDSSSPLPGAFVVTASHTYQNPGTYPVTVKLSAALGQRATVLSTAVIGDNPVRAFGRSFTLHGRTLTNTVLATIADESPGAPSDYSARIHWGDGQITPGTVLKTAAGELRVLGTHSYLDATDYAITVEVTKTAGSPVYAWSRVSLIAPTAPIHLPPYPVAHLVGELVDAANHAGQVTLATEGGKTFATAELIVVNSGTKTMPGGKLRFYLSEDKKASVGDKSVTIGSLKEVQLPAIRPNGVTSFVFKKSSTADFRLRFPAGETGDGLNLLAHFDYTDPVADSLPIARDVVVGPLKAPSN